jgi:hypothetical protein
LLLCIVKKKSKLYAPIDMERERERERESEREQ